MACGGGAGEGAVGKAQRIVDSPEDPQCEGVQNLRYGAGIQAEPIGEIDMARRVVELDCFLNMLMSAGKIAELKAGAAGNAIRDQGLGTSRPGGGFAQKKLGHFAS
jgi:hypothetical protein